MEPTRKGETLLEIGVVVATMPASGASGARAQVRLLAGDHCEGCPSACLCRPEGADRRRMDVADPVGVTVGDRVQVAVPGGQVLKASFLVYGLPLLLLLLGVWLGTRLFPPTDALRDLWSFLIGTGLAAAAIPFVRATLRRTEEAGGPLLAARIIARLPEAEEGSGHPDGGREAVELA
jgi:sigma-E factor negative regulatory protein RseC